MYRQKGINKDLCNEIYKILKAADRVLRPTEVHEEVMKIQRFVEAKISRTYCTECLMYLQNIGYASSTHTKKWRASGEAIKLNVAEVGDPLKPEFKGCKIYVVPLYIARDPRMVAQPNLEQYAISEAS